MRGRIDLLHTALLPRAVPPALATVALLLATGGWLSWNAARVDVERARAERDAAALLSGGPAVQAQSGASGPAAPAAAPRARGADRPTADPAEQERGAIARLLETDWNHRLLRMEEASSGLVSLSGLKVDARNALVELRGEVVSLDRLEVLRTRLLDAGATSVQLTRHEAVVRPTGVRQSFVIGVEWPR